MIMFPNMKKKMECMTFGSLRSCGHIVPPVFEYCARVARLQWNSSARNVHFSQSYFDLNLPRPFYVANMFSCESHFLFLPGPESSPLHLKCRVAGAYMASAAPSACSLEIGHE